MNRHIHTACESVKKTWGNSEELNLVHRKFIENECGTFQMNTLSSDPAIRTRKIPSHAAKVTRYKLKSLDRSQVYTKLTTEWPKLHSSSLPDAQVIVRSRTSCLSVCLVCIELGFRNVWTILFSVHCSYTMWRWAVVCIKNTHTRFTTCFTFNILFTGK